MRQSPVARQTCQNRELLSLDSVWYCSCHLSVPTQYDGGSPAPDNDVAQGLRRVVKECHLLQLPDIKWVFFDIGYTLINEDDAVGDRILQVQAALKNRGVSVSAEAIRAALEKAAAEGAPTLVSRAIAILADSEELGERLKARFAWRKDLERPYPQAERVLSELSSRYNIGIIANQSAGTEARLHSWGLLSFISLVIASAEVGLNKPDLSIFQLAMRRAGARPTQIVMVGDRIDNDITPAKSLGWKTIRIKQGLSKGQVSIGHTQAPDFEVHRLDDILRILL